MIPRNIRRKIFERDEGVCQYCGVNLIPFNEIENSRQDRYFWVDHIDPKSASMNHEIVNLIASCCKCNKYFMWKIHGKDVFSMLKKNFNKYVIADDALAIFESHGIRRTRQWLDQQVVKKNISSDKIYTTRVYLRKEIEQMAVKMSSE